MNAIEAKLARIDELNREIAEIKNGLVLEGYDAHDVKAATLYTLARDGLSRGVNAGWPALHL